MRLNRERGQVALLLVVLLGLAGALLVYGGATEIVRTVKADTATREALAYAKEALVGYAIGHGTRPGSLPCPDIDNDGLSDLVAGDCPALGRLPWRTLGVGDLRDDSGETLWYALSTNFGDRPIAPPLNSDTLGTFSVYSGSTASPVTTQAAAIVFAPGGALPGQTRGSSIAACSTTGSAAAANLCGANYLDAAGPVDNGAGGSTYIATAGPAFNDKLAVIAPVDFMPLVEHRAAIDLRNALLAYRANTLCACYPWPDTGNDGISDSGTNRGRIPHVTASPEPWAPGMLPAYLAANEWTRVIYYAVGRSSLVNGGAACSTCNDPNLTFDWKPGYDVVLVTPGFASASRSPVSWTDYIDDAQNRNNDDTYITPLSVAPNRDRIYPLAGAAIGCSANAQVLINNAPCGGPGNSVKRVCQSAAANLQACTCKGAANDMVTPPCTNQLNPPKCQTAVVQLQACPN